METLPLELVWEETFLIEGRIKNEDTEDGERVAKELLTRLAPLYLAQVWPPNERPLGMGIPPPETIMVHELEAWFLRDKVQSSDRVGEKNVGIGLLRKLYTIILDFDRARKTEPITDQYTEAEEQPPAHTVEEWQKQEEPNA